MEQLISGLLGRLEVRRWGWFRAVTLGLSRSEEPCQLWCRGLLFLQRVTPTLQRCNAKKNLCRNSPTNSYRISNFACNGAPTPSFFPEIPLVSCAAMKSIFCTMPSQKLSKRNQLIACGTAACQRNFQHLAYIGSMHTRGEAL